MISRLLDFTGRIHLLWFVREQSRRFYGGEGKIILTNMLSLPEEKIAIMIHAIFNYPAQVRTWISAQCAVLSLGLGDFVDGEVGAGM